MGGTEGQLAQVSPCLVPTFMVNTQHQVKHRPAGKPSYGNRHCRSKYFNYGPQTGRGLVYACHCNDCQSMTSSAFSMALVLPAGAFRLLSGEPQMVRRQAESGRMTTRWICSKCGSWMGAGPVPVSAVRNVRAGT